MNAFEGQSAGYQSYLGSGGTPSKTPYKIFGGKMAKQVVRMSSGFLKIRIWRVWKGRPPPKCKKKLCTE
jgi:hypothetical protein